MLLFKSVTFNSVLSPYKNQNTFKVKITLVYRKITCFTVREIYRYRTVRTGNYRCDGSLHNVNCTVQYAQYSNSWVCQPFSPLPPPSPEKMSENSCDVCCPKGLHGHISKPHQTWPCRQGGGDIQADLCLAYLGGQADQCLAYLVGQADQCLAYLGGQADQCLAY